MHEHNYNKGDRWFVRFENMFILKLWQKKVSNGGKWHVNVAKPLVTKTHLIYKFTCLPVYDVTFCCIIIFYVSAAKPAIGKSIFVWNWHPWETLLISTQLSIRSSVRPSMTGRSDPLTVSAMSILQPPRNEPQRPILLRICFFFYLFF
jgi:hypothetical protein